MVSHVLLLSSAACALVHNIDPSATPRRIRDTIDDILTTNRELGLIVAMETALTDGRFEVGEASRLPDCRCALSVELRRNKDLMNAYSFLLRRKPQLCATS